MRNLDRHLDRILTALRNRIREKGFTQLEVQEALGWGRSYLSQLLTKQKSLRVEQVLLVLNVINVDPADFWGELYQFGQFGDAPARRGRGVRRPVPFAAVEEESMLADVGRIEQLVRAVVTVLERKKLIAAGDFDAAVSRFSQKSA